MRDVVLPFVLLTIGFSLLSAAAGMSGEAAQTAILPLTEAWNGASRALVVQADHPWITPAEKAKFRTTPSYEETVVWLRRLVAASPELTMLSLGKSDEGRDIWMVVASKEHAFTPAALRATRKPTILAQCGIHSGEIDGKDAGLMLLRDMTTGPKKSLLAGANFLFVPILNVDGHERASRFNRINQRGPENGGWRTNAKNLNLNRDYAKLDTPEVRSVVKALNEWQPDLYFDIHVTDGGDYQYDITYGWNGPIPQSPGIARWLATHFKPAADRDLTAAGHIPGIQVFFESTDPMRGIDDWFASPRYSNGYGDARHLPTVLVETHSLKPYDQRVLGTYVLLESAMRSVAASTASLRAAVADDQSRRPASVPLEYTYAETPTTIDFAGIDYRLRLSPISGQVAIDWLGKPLSMKMPVLPKSTVVASASRSKAYWVPAAWPDVIDRLALHGIRFESVAQARTLELEMYRVSEVKLATEAYEGRIAVTANVTPEKRRETYAAGSVRVPTDQPLGDLAVLLLEPASPDSFFRWGFFDSVLQPTEYVEAYIMEPMAVRMMAEDPALAKEFEQKLIDDAAFRSSATERLQWFYRRTPFYDPRALLYPVGRE